MPWALAAAAASAIASYETQSENNANTQRQYNAKNAVQAQGQVQQNANTAQGQSILGNTIAKFQPGQVGADTNTAIANRTNALTANLTTPASINDPTSNANAPQVVQDDLANKMAGAAAFGAQQADALGRIGGNTDAAVGQAINLNSSGQQLGQLSNFAHGDAGVNQAQAEAAYNNARKPANPLWGLVGTAASALAMHGAANGAMGNELNEVPSSTGASPGYTVFPQSLPAGTQGPIQPSMWGS
jgi:hypothetical protein